MTDETPELPQVRAAFDRLRDDAAALNTMSALHAHEANAAGPGGASTSPAWNPAVVFGGLAALALVALGAISLFGGGSATVEIDVADAPERSETQPGPTRATDLVTAPTLVDARTTFTDLACGAVGSSEVDGASVGELAEVVAYESDTCRRTVFRLTPGSLVDASDITWAPGVGGGIDIAHAFELRADPTLVEDRVVGFSGQAARDDGSVYLHVHHGQPAANTSVTVLQDPARIVVDTRVTGPSVQPQFGDTVILPGPLGSVSLPLVVRGHGRPFEAQGSVEIRQAPTAGQPPGSGELVNADWSGQGGAIGPRSGPRYAYRANWFAWGDFTFVVDGLAGGDYELIFLNYGADGDTEPFDLIAPFSVTAGASPPLGDPAPNRCDREITAGASWFVTNVAPDDPDGGLVAHTGPGIEAPVTRVLPMGTEVTVSGGCVVLASGANWLELVGSNGTYEWVNGHFVAP